jgi:hypothetical protein
LERKAVVRPKRALIDPSGATGGAAGPVVRGNSMWWLAGSSNVKRSCMPMRKKRTIVGGYVGSAVTDWAPM